MRYKIVILLLYYGFEIEYYYSWVTKILRHYLIFEFLLKTVIT